MTTLNKTSGVLTSPYYPRRYPSNVNCSWKIIASKGESIVLSIEDIDIVDCGSSCTCDYLKIQNGSSSDGISSRRRCGNYKDREIIYRSAKDVLRVTFVSDSGTYRRYRGFKATYIEVKYNATNTACTSGEYLNGFSGFFSTPNFPSNFPQYSKCTWNITVPSGYIIKLSFLYFRLEPHQYFPCYNNPEARVTVTNVASDDGYQPFMLCGQCLPSPVYSVGNSVQVIFTSLRSQYPGFNATYTAITYSSVCPNMATLNETSGVLTSPYYPRRYPFKEKCSWKIIASKGERILLFIEDIHIANCGLSCTCDCLEIQNGSSSDGISVRRRCRYYKDRGIVYHSVKDVLRVTFVSNSSTYRRYRGFKATYIKVKYNATNTACTSGEYLNGFSGFFSTPNFPNNYPQYSKCTWNITVPSGYIIKLSFLYFGLEPYQYILCYYYAPGARVTVTNVASDDGYQPFMLCGQSLPPAVYSVGNSVQVIFTSLNSQYPGFNATYTAITYSSGTWYTSFTRHDLVKI
ncbi:unnamed protein product [Porites lobata]|uniref:CUB domain-containing protein n=1 Tax=Porites lobata TaxID=104759 RepID=A0ABN8QL26_9CNID|nr:unnamed protein product [Porites lobata]